VTAGGFDRITTTQHSFDGAGLFGRLDNEEFCLQV
jgi:hypothetical protein